MSTGSMQQTMISSLISCTNILIAIINEVLIKLIGYHYKS